MPACEDLYPIKDSILDISGDVHVIFVDPCVIKGFFYEGVRSNGKLVSVLIVRKDEKPNNGGDHPKQTSDIGENAIKFAVLPVN